MGLWTEIKERLRAHSALPALGAPDGSFLTYRQLLDVATAVGHAISRKTEPGQTVAILGSHPYYDAVGILGTLAAGRLAVPLGKANGEQRCLKIMQVASISLLVTDSSMAATPSFKAYSQHAESVLLVDADLPAFDGPEPITDPEHPEMLFFTSGSTGVPKGVLLSARNILTNAYDIQAYFALTISDHLLVVRSLSIASAFTGEFLVALLSGARLTFLAEGFIPRRVLGLIRRLECTALCTTPTLFHHMVWPEANLELPSLQKVALSGECLLPIVAQRLQTRLPHVHFYNVYGLTEAAPRVSYLPPEQLESKPLSVGTPLAHVQVQIVDDQGRELPPGEVGEVAVAGPNVMVGYWNDPEGTALRLRAGWLHTGDLGYTDCDGFLYIVGRQDHMIIRCGVNVHPEELESCLLEEPAIKEVMVWGERDLQYGERIFCDVVPHTPGQLTVMDVMALCCQRLDSCRWPDQVRIVESLPRTATGKLLRRASMALEGKG